MLSVNCSEDVYKRQTQLNNRDHRKIAVIDGHTAFTGGINLADEYINVIERFGHWKDTAIVVQGEAAWSFTVMFLSLWSYLKGTNENFEQFRPSPQSLARFPSSGSVSYTHLFRLHHRKNQ